MDTKKDVIRPSYFSKGIRNGTKISRRCVSNKTFPTKLHKKLALILKKYIKNKKNR